MFYWTDALSSVSSGCKMAYGSGTSLSGLSFTPVVAIIIARRSSTVDEYYSLIAIKGYDTSSKLVTVSGISGGINSSYGKCTFKSDSVSFSNFNSNYELFSYKAQIAAFGM